MVSLDIKAAAMKIQSSGEAVRLSAYKAINATMRTLETSLINEVSAEVGIAKKFIMQRLYMSKASLRRNQAKLTENIWTLPAILFDPTDTKTIGVLASKYHWRTGFIAKVHKKSNYPERVMMRKGTARLPIKELKIPIEEKSRQVLSEIERNVFEIFSRNFENEIKKYQEKLSL